MNPQELRNPGEARDFLLQGLWLQRALAPNAATLSMTLEWALETAAAGQPLPALGFLADLGQATFNPCPGLSPDKATWATAGLPANLARSYEDHVLGKLASDASFERASAAMRRYQGRDRARALTFVWQRVRERAECGGILLSPVAIKTILAMPPVELLRAGWEALPRAGSNALVRELYESLITGVRRLADLLGSEDVFELEHGSALAPLGQRIAVRQVLLAAQQFEEIVPRVKPRPSSRKQEVPTHILEEDTYPVGGFSSLSTRGSIESLLHSQLAFMEKDDRPDLFDIKFLRDELLYYARDENRFLRRRRCFVFALFPDLVATRSKDDRLPWQLGVVLLALLVVAARKLTDWLGSDALTIEFLFLEEGGALVLDLEKSLLETLLREPIANRTVNIASMQMKGLSRHCAARARRSMCHCLTVSVEDRPLLADNVVVTRLRAAGSSPTLSFEHENAFASAGGLPMENWGAVLELLFAVWI